MEETDQLKKVLKNNEEVGKGETKGGNVGGIFEERMDRVREMSRSKGSNVGWPLILSIFHVQKFEYLIH